MNDDEEMREFTPHMPPTLTLVSPQRFPVDITWATPPSAGRGYMPVLPSTGMQTWLCPDLLSIHQIGAADGLRGRIVRGFFRVMEWLPL